VREAGTADAPGNPTLYATTATFLEKYGLSSIADLPNLEEFAPDEKTAQLIRERLGAPAQTELLPAENAMPSPEQMATDAQAALFGVVEKVDFDSLTFNMDDE
jgi:segregation and condensation protein B